MVNKYVKKNNQRIWNENDTEKVIQGDTVGYFNFAVFKYNIPHEMLSIYAKKKFIREKLGSLLLFLITNKRNNCPTLKSYGRFIFWFDERRVLESYTLYCSSRPQTLKRASLNFILERKQRVFLR
jgi:hypothetical protein